MDLDDIVSSKGGNHRAATARLNCVWGSEDFSSTTGELKCKETWRLLQQRRKEKQLVHRLPV